MVHFILKQRGKATYLARLPLVLYSNWHNSNLFLASARAPLSVMLCLAFGTFEFLDTCFFNSALPWAWGLYLIQVAPA